MGEQLPSQGQFPSLYRVHGAVGLLEEWVEGYRRNSSTSFVTLCESNYFNGRSYDSNTGTLLAVQGLRLHRSAVRGADLIFGWELRSPYAARHSQKIKKAKATDLVA